MAWRVVSAIADAHDIDLEPAPPPPPAQPINWAALPIRLLVGAGTVLAALVTSRIGWLVINGKFDILMVPAPPSAPSMVPDDATALVLVD